MRIGVHLCFWQTVWDEDVTPHIHRAAELGFDGVEISLFTLRHWDSRAVRREVERAGLGLTCSTGFGPGEDVTSADPAARRAGLEALRRAAALATDAGSHVLCGVLYAPWKKFYTHAERRDALARSVDAVRTVGEEATRADLVLAMEVLNRYETPLINTAEQARAFTDAVGLRNVGIHLDTYHMNIEERVVPHAIATAGASLVHFHCGEGDRGTPDPNGLPWKAIVTALRQIGYDRWLTLECCTRAGTEVADTFNVWRDLGPDRDAAARESLAFLRGLAGRVS
jgi:D-psicose/D-tagatose/L-ribulose 3-epimerase